MARLQPDELIAGEHALHLRDRIEPIALIEAAHLAEIVEDDEAALEEIIPESRDFFVVRRPAARLGEVGNRVLQELGIVEREDVPADDLAPLHEGTHRRQLAHDLHEVDVGAWIVV